MIFMVSSKIFSLPNEDSFETFKKTIKQVFKPYIEEASKIDPKLEVKLKKFISELENTDYLPYNEEYTRLFRSAKGGVPCPPYASIYSGVRLLMTDETMEIGNLYSEAGLIHKSSEPPDYIVSELEFLSYLLINLSNEGNYISLFNRFISHLDKWIFKFISCVKENSRVELLISTVELLEDALDVMKEEIKKLEG